MMRFLDVCRDRARFVAELSALLERDAEKEADELLRGLSPIVEDEHEVGVALAGECLLVRIYDEGYAFPYPYPLTDSADLRAALLALSAYMRREMLPPVFTDVPREELSMLSSVFHRLNAAAYEDDEDYFFVRAESECRRFSLDEPLCAEGVSLSELSDEDEEAFFRLATDTELNKFWGYDYREDDPSPDAGYFLRVARGEREAGVALSLAVRLGREMIGEGVIFDFDYRGTAQIGVRLLPEYHGQGIGKCAMGLLLSVAEKMGLSALRAEVMLENFPSLALVRRYFEQTETDGEKAYFTLKLS